MENCLATDPQILRVGWVPPQRKEKGAAALIHHAVRGIHAHAHAHAYSGDILLFRRHLCLAIILEQQQPR